MPAARALYIHVQHINGAGLQLMDEYKSARSAMIDSQLRTSGVTERRLLSAMAEVPRELFVPEGRRAIAYLDGLQPLANGQRFILSPAHFGRMVQLAQIREGDWVLDVGAASGYSSIVLARLGGSVLGIEFDVTLAAQANENLARFGTGNASVLTGGVELAAGRHFDAIIVEGAVETAPDDLIALLAPGGRLVAPILRNGVAVVHVFVRKPEGVMFTSEFDASMPRLWNWAPENEFVF